MQEKKIQGGIMNGVKMLVCPTWERNFREEIQKTGGCFRINMDYSAVDVSWWKELEKIAVKYGYTLDEECIDIIQEYVKKYKKYTTTKASSYQTVHSLNCKECTIAHIRLFILGGRA